MNRRVIRLDASKWKSWDDFYSDLLPQLGAPEWHGRNVNALNDSIAGGMINSIEPPYTIEIAGTQKLSSDLAAAVEVLNAIAAKARRYDRDVDLKIS